MKNQSQTINENTIGGYGREYTESGFWSKIHGCARKAGRRVVLMALELYYAYKNGNLSAWDKALILAALGYLISPVDLIPDAIPIVGFSDDMGALALVYEKISAAITEEVKEQARRKCESIMG